MNFFLSIKSDQRNALEILLYLLMMLRSQDFVHFTKIIQSIHKSVHILIKSETFNDQLINVSVSMKNKVFDKLSMTKFRIYNQATFHSFRF